MLFIIFSFDIALQTAINSTGVTSEQRNAFITEMQGQIFFLAGTLLLKRAQKVCNYFLALVYFPYFADYFPDFGLTLFVPGLLSQIAQAYLHRFWFFPIRTRLVSVKS